MTEPFLGEIRQFSFNFAPSGWALCNGQLLPIAANQALYALLSTTYGGNGSTTFALPDFRGRVPISRGEGHTLGEAGGAEAVTLGWSHLPAHNHALMASLRPGNSVQPAGRVLAGPLNQTYRQPSTMASAHAGSITTAGSGAAHENRQPFLVWTFCIALTGIFPTQN